MGIDFPFRASKNRSDAHNSPIYYNNIEDLFLIDMTHEMPSNYLPFTSTHTQKYFIWLINGHELHKQRYFIKPHTHSLVAYYKMLSRHSDTKMPNAHEIS